MCSSRIRNTYGITTSSFSPPTNEAIPLRLALLNPWLAPWIGYRTADGYFSTACSEYLMSTMKSLVPCWDGWKYSYSRTYPYEYAKGRLNQSSATLPAEAAGNQSESPKSSLNLATRSSCQWPISFIVPKKNLSTSGSSTHCSPPISERLSHSHLTRSATYFI